MNLANIADCVPVSCITATAYASCALLSDLMISRIAVCRLWASRCHWKRDGHEAALCFIHLCPGAEASQSHEVQVSEVTARIVMSSFFCQSPNIKFAKFYTEAFQAILPNLMATKMSQYTVWPLNMNCIIGARYGSLKVMAAFSERFLRTNSSTNKHKWQWADTEDSSVLIKYVIIRCIMHNWE